MRPRHWCIPARQDYEPFGFESTYAESSAKGVNRPILQKIGGEGGIRTHVEGLTAHPISSRRRYDRFGTSPGSIQVARKRCCARLILTQMRGFVCVQRTIRG